MTPPSYFFTLGMTISASRRATSHGSYLPVPESCRPAPNPIVAVSVTSTITWQYSTVPVLCERTAVRPATVVGLLVIPAPAAAWLDRLSLPKSTFSEVSLDHWQIGCPLFVL